ncbi:uncharacterized protein LOC100848357 isoform 1 [Bos taurus]|uniref:Uncharacterized protein n=1 Tax=Bos taurus TaxID=9913 RepID=A0A3Q1N4X9_BOVIN|nr:uncharacterized protein LOC100848357 isoform 1 [Bos taurus]
MELRMEPIPPGSGRGAHDPGNEPRIGAGGPESQECSAPVCSNGRGAQQPPDGPGHKPTSEEKRAEVEEDPPPAPHCRVPSWMYLNWRGVRSLAGGLPSCCDLCHPLLHLLQSLQDGHPELVVCGEEEWAWGGSLGRVQGMPWATKPDHVPGSE